MQGYDYHEPRRRPDPHLCFQESPFWLPVNYTYMDLQSDKYYTGTLVTPTYLHQVTDKIGLEVGAKFNNQHFWTPLYLSQDNRSGNLWGGNVGMYYFFKKQQGFVQARIGYWNNNTKGDNWDSNSYNLLLSLLWPISDKLKYNMFLDLTQQPFNNTWYNGATVDNVQGVPRFPNPSGGTKF